MVISSTPQVNHGRLLLLGSDRLYLNLCKGATSIKAGGGARAKATPSGASSVSSPQWKVIQYPSSYLALNWPIKVSSSHTH